MYTNLQFHSLISLPHRESVAVSLAGAWSDQEAVDTSYLEPCFCFFSTDVTMVPARTIVMVTMEML